MHIVRWFLVVCVVVCGCLGGMLTYYHKPYYQENYKHQIDSILLKMQTKTTKYHNEEFYVVPNLIPSNMKRDASNDTKIMVITQTSINNLYQISNLSRKWDGQISMTVYSIGSEISQTLHYILLMRKCFVDVRNKVSFHLLYPISKPLINLTNLTSVYKMEFDCQLLSVLRYKHLTENFDPGKPYYPVNVARNVALMYSMSDYVFYLDVDISPSKVMKKEMEAFLEKHEFNETMEKMLYVVPSFETNSSSFNSLSKAELIRAVANGSTRPFWIEICAQCHIRTNFSRWLSLPYPSELNISYYVDYSWLYEPYYIAARKHNPPFDTRFQGWGLDRLSQVCEAYVRGNGFAVMNNVFVIHDGFKTRKTFTKWKRKEDERKKKIFASTFMPDLKIKYPESKRECKRKRA